MTVSLLSSLVVLFALSVTGLGFLRIWHDDTLDRNSHIMRNLRYGVMGIAVIIVMRTGFWDVVYPLAGYPDGFRWINILFNLGVVIPCYFWLKAKWWLIPAEERGRYTWYNAWCYPVQWRIVVRRGGDRD